MIAVPIPIRMLSYHLIAVTVTTNGCFFVYRMMGVENMVE